MSKLNQRIVSIWIEASEDLGFRIIAPFSQILCDGRAVTHEVFLPDFGGPFGAILMGEDAERDPIDVRYFRSVLVDGWTRYDREQFIATLNDLGSFGPASEPPDWYTGGTVDTVTPLSPCGRGAGGEGSHLRHH